MFNFIVDTETFTINYADPFVLMSDLKCMGDGNANIHRTKFTSKETFWATAAAYSRLFGNTDGSVPATFQVFYYVLFINYDYDTIIFRSFI